MNLESLEERSAQYLEQTSSPLVPIDRVLRYVVQAPDCADTSERELLEFLGANPLFRVIESTPNLGAGAGPLIALATRIPSQHELTTQIQAQLGQMRTALARALEEAETAGEPNAIAQIRLLLTQTDTLLAKAGKMA